MTDATSPREDGLLLSLRELSDDELVARLEGLAARERRATADLVAHLAEMDTRDVYLRAGYSSLFAYSCDALALSEHEALNRIEAARTARRFPVVLGLLESGEITLTTVRLLAPHLTDENQVRVLESARRKRKAGVQEIVARLSPRADVPASIRKLSPPKQGVLTSDVVGKAPQPPVSQGVLASGAGSVGYGGAGRPAAPASLEERPENPRESGLVGASEPNGGPISFGPRPPAHSAEVTPLSPDRYKYQLTIGRGTLEKLRFAKDLLRHALPSGDDEAILDRALSALLTELARARFGGERKAGSSDSEENAPGEEPGSREDAPLGRGGTPRADSRDIPVAIRRTVWVRDLGRCAFLSGDGRRCDERAFVEFHHVKPYAVGGRPTVDNVQLRCRSHNGYEARVFFAREADEGLRPLGAGTPVQSSSRRSGARQVPPRRDRPGADAAGRSGTGARGAWSHSGSRRIAERAATGDRGLSSNHVGLQAEMHSPGPLTRVPFACRPG
jgi:hypothetical protein